MLASLRKHWPEYLMEGAELGLFMISACAFGIILGHPDSAVRRAIPSGVLRQVLGGVAMGVTAISIIYSPWGKQSGAHFNPAVTLTFFRLGKAQPWDAFFYVIAQFVGGVAGVALFASVFGRWLAHPSVNFVATVPGSEGAGVAFLAEVIITFILMTVILNVTNVARIARYTGLFAGALVATYISVEAPYSGMSMNPARTFGSALLGHVWTALWIYFTAPMMGMLLAAQLYLQWKGRSNIRCAKLHHQNNKRCIFCGFGMEEPERLIMSQAAARSK